MSSATQPRQPDFVLLVDGQPDAELTALARSAMETLLAQARDVDDFLNELAAR